MKQENEDVKLTINTVEQEAAAPLKEVVADAAMRVSLTPDAAEGKGSATETGAVTGSAAKKSEAAKPESGAHKHDTAMERIVNEEVHESEVQPPSSFSLNRALGGAMLANVIQGHIKMMLLIFMFLIIYITCRYKCQEKMVEIDRLEQKLIQARYKATVYTSQLTEKSRESNILEMLKQKGDSTLQIPTEPPYKIDIPE